MGSGEHYCLRWNNHQSNLLGVFSQLLEDGSLVDVTLTCAEEGQSIRAHKVVLSACSSYFQTLFVAHPTGHPIVILKDVCYKELRTLVDFMYKGEVNVEYCRLSALLDTAESLKVKGLAEMTKLRTEKERDDRDRESRERDKDRDRDKDNKEREREQDRDREQRSREERDRERERDRDRERDHDRERESKDRDQGERDRRRDRSDRERDREQDRDSNQERERDHREREDSSGREEDLQRHHLHHLHHHLHHQPPQLEPQSLLPRHRHSAPSPGPPRSANGINVMVPDSPELLHSHPLGLPQPHPLSLTHHHSRLLNSSPDSPPPPRPPSHSRSLSPPPSKRVARPRSRLEAQVDSSPDNSCHDPGGAMDGDCSPTEADMMTGSPMSTCSTEPNDMTMATNLSNPSNNSGSTHNNNNNSTSNNNNNGIPSTLAGCSGCPPGVCGLPSSGGPSPLSLVQPPGACSSAASSRLTSPLALAPSPIPGPSGMPPVQQVPLSLKKEVDWDRGDRDDKSVSGESPSDYSRHPPDSESQGLGGRGGGSGDGERCSSPPRPFHCSYCGASFPHQSKLTRHILSHSLETLKFREQLAMQPPPGLGLLPGSLEPLNLIESHLASVSHYHESPLMELDGSPGAPNAVLCKFCGKSFPDVGSLITHLPAHTGDRPFKCEFCGKAFKLRHHMKDHCRVHTGERPFRCALCGKTFSRSTILKAHEKTHYPKYVRKFLSPGSPVDAGEEAPQQ